jgi:inorganic pyrophosphatase
MSESIVDVIIEISKGSHIKYEYDKNKNIITCDRVLHTPMKYPFNYGFIPDTLSEDGDPLDVVVLMEDELLPGCSIKCKILGYLETKDDSGNDPKLIVCPIGNIDPTWKYTNSLTWTNGKVDKHTIEKIIYFFKRYKDLENKTVEIGELFGIEMAVQIYKESKERFINKNVQKNKITTYFKKI